MQDNRSISRVGVYVDTANMYRNGGYRMRYDVPVSYTHLGGSWWSVVSIQ